jgi:hypothetical protein
MLSKTDIKMHLLVNKRLYEHTFFVYFQSQLLAPLMIMIYHHLKLSEALITFTQITTQLSAGHTVSSQFLLVCCLLLSHQKQSPVNDCPQMIHSVSCCVSVTVCSFLFCHFIESFSVFHSVCLLLSQLYSQYFTFSTSSCSYSQSTLNTVTQL